MITASFLSVANKARGEFGCCNNTTQETLDREAEILGLPILLISTVSVLTKSDFICSEVMTIASSNCCAHPYITQKISSDSREMLETYRKTISKLTQSLSAFKRQIYPD